jgi:tRNA(Ile)-lysidine synthase
MTPIDVDEFGAMMAALGPWGAARRVGVAVSGGADSLALAFLLARWGAPRAFVVDHGLRRESGAEAAAACETLARFGVAGRVLSLRGLRRGPGLAARARAARYDALIGAARAEGFADLLLGHHLRDQAETVLMRRRAHSGATGLAAMAAIVELNFLRLVRPLLGVAPGRLRATLVAAGIAWVEDPSNDDPATLRARLRRELDDSDGDGPVTVELAEAAFRQGIERAEAERGVAAVLAKRAMVRPEGFAVLSPGSLPAAALSALIRTIGGGAYPVSSTSVARLAAAPRPAVLGGARLMDAGRLGPGLLLVREASQMQGAVPAAEGSVWDRRFRMLEGQPADTTIGALGPDAASARAYSDLPAAVLVTLPALRVHGLLAAVPHIGYPEAKFCARMVFSPASNAAGAPFLPPARGM